MAKRFTDAEKARAVKKVEKLRAEGKSLNAACEEVVQKTGWPSVGALTNWVKAAAAANGAVAEEPAAEAAPAPRKRVVKKAPKPRAATARKRAASANGSSTAEKAAPRPAAVPAPTLVAEPEPEPTAVVEESAAVAETPAAEQPAAEQPAAELVAVSAIPAATVTPVADAEFGHRSADDLANEVRRLRIALEELHGENRALKDLVGIYVRR